MGFKNKKGIGCKFHHQNVGFTQWETHWSSGGKKTRTKSQLSIGGLFGEKGTLELGIITSCLECLIIAIRAGLYWQKTPD